MAALRRLMVGLNPIPTTVCRSLLPPPLLISCRGIAFKLFVGGLSYHTTEDGLTRAFSECGEVLGAEIVMDKYLDRSKGFGFVTFASNVEARNAIDVMNGKTLNGRKISVDYAKPSTRDFRARPPIACGPPEPIASEPPEKKANKKPGKKAGKTADKTAENTADE